MLNPHPLCLSTIALATVDASVVNPILHFRTIRVIRS